MLVNHKIQIFLDYFVFLFWMSNFGISNTIDRIPSLRALTHVTLYVWTAQGKAISKFRKPEVPPLHPTLLGTETALHLRCVTRLTFGCMLRCLGWNVVPSWFRYTSYMLKYTCFLYHPSYTHNHENTITRRRSHNQDRTRIRVRFRPSPHKPTAREMESVRATLQEGRYYFGCGRRRCFLKVYCLSDKRASSDF